MIQRRLAQTIIQSLSRFPAVGLVGARQVGKTTLAKHLATQLAGNVVYLDLERPSDLGKLTEPELYLERHANALVILDEVQRKPDVFPVIRTLVDSDHRNGRFLLLGSASPQLIRQSSESLAGRIVYHELPPLSLDEVRPTESNVRTLWFRGGFPDSFLAASDEESAAWRAAFIETHLERDLPALGIRIPATSLRRFWQMLAHAHGNLWNASRIAAGLGISAPTVRHYLDVLQDTFMVRQLHPYHANLKKRLVKSPKIYLRDSGLLHALLNLSDIDDLFGHPCIGASFEGWMIEQLIATVPSSWKPYFYRTAAGAEIDLVLERSGRRPLLAIEIKYSLNPAPSRGFWSALGDLGKVKGYVIAPVVERYPIAKAVDVLPVNEATKHLLEGS